MTSSASQSSDVPAGSAAEKSARRSRMLAALEIDVWTLRPASQAVAQSTDAGLSVSPDAQAMGTANAPANTPSRPPVRELPARTGAGPAAALALLEASPKPGSAWETSASPEPSAESKEPSADSKEPSAESKDPSADSTQAIEPLDLWCLSSPHGVVLAHHEGLSPSAQRLLKDILHSATQVIGNRLQASVPADAPKKPSRTKLQALRFSWPPASENGELLADQDTARALRGFLTRQLKNAAEPVLLYVADDIGNLLASIDLPVESSRRVELMAPDLLMSDSTTKRALWRTLSAL